MRLLAKGKRLVSDVHKTEGAACEEGEAGCAGGGAPPPHTPLVLTNSKMRKLLAEAATVGRDLLARGAVKTTEGVAHLLSLRERNSSPCVLCVSDSFARLLSAHCRYLLTPLALASPIVDLPEQH
ncbi:hypothetical protein B0H10DRAFT_371284 [Mycena sp. CBHHK59/15]|nr:hypothetical protein B0H10DRAFT_371284 [Mycena sp. CBHHK59/15]